MVWTNRTWGLEDRRRACGSYTGSLHFTRWTNLIYVARRMSGVDYSGRMMAINARIAMTMNKGGKII
jgi:hypothetical protein